MDNYTSLLKESALLLFSPLWDFGVVVTVFLLPLACCSVAVMQC